MRIDKRLHLVVPIYADEEDGGELVAYVHSAPLSEEAVDRWFLVLGQTYSAIFSEGLGMAGGPGHAMRMLKRVATDRGVWHDDGKGGLGVEHGLVDEIRRLTNVAARDEKGKWEPIPLDVAVKRGVISASDKTEVENSIAFFIAASATLSRALLPGHLKLAAGLWGAQVTSSPFTEWVSGLKTSTGTVNSGAKSPAPVNAAHENAAATPAARRSSVPF